MDKCGWSASFWVPGEYGYVECSLPAWHVGAHRHNETGAHWVAADENAIPPE